MISARILKGGGQWRETRLLIITVYSMPRPRLAIILGGVV